MHLLVGREVRSVSLDRVVRVHGTHNFITSVCMRRLAGEAYWYIGTEKLNIIEDKAKVIDKYPSW
jgi:hypothetical protein